MPAKPHPATPAGRAAPRGDGIDMGMLPGLVGFNLRCAQLAVFQHFGATVGAENVSPPQFGTLLLIEANPGISQSAVAEALRFDRSTLVQIIDRLEGRDFVARRASPQDRRSHALELTETGAEFLAKLKVLALDHENDAAAALTDAERAQLIALLQKISGA
ncbi:MAG: MarR family transcriptional regulator [Rhodospirillaceae bacterium]